MPNPWQTNINVISYFFPITVSIQAHPYKADRNLERYFPLKTRDLDYFFLLVFTGKTLEKNKQKFQEYILPLCAQIPDTIRFHLRRLQYCAAISPEEV